MGQVPEDGPQAPNIFQDVVDFSSDSEDDEVAEHWPPGLQFLDGEDFILGNPHHNAAPAAWKRDNYTFETWCSIPIKCYFPVICSVPQSMITTTVNSLYTDHQHCMTASKRKVWMNFSFKQKSNDVFFVFLIAFNLYIFLAKLLPSDLSFCESNHFNITTNQC